MKVLMLSKACYVASYRQKLVELAALPQVELTLVVPPYWGRGKSRAAFERGNEGNYRTIIRNPVLNGNFHLHFYPGLRRLLQNLRPDIFHIDEEPYDLVTWHALLASRGLGVKTLFFTWQNILRRLPPPFNLFEAWNLRHADGAIAGSASAAQVLRDKGFFKPLTVIPQFGVDPEIFFPRREEPPEAPGRSFRIGYVGRLVEEKGLLMLLEAVAGLGGDWELYFVGAGPLRPELERRIAERGLGQRVHLLGSVPSQEVPEQLRRLDVLVLPSLTTSHWKEQFGRVLIEAMTCGVVVVGSDSGEIPSVIGDGGLVFPEGNVPALRGGLFELVSSPARRRELSQQGRQRVADCYTQKKVAQDTYGAYQRLLSGEGGR